MIELPESCNLAEQIKENLVGKKILNVYANKSPHKFAWFSGEPELYHEKFAEKTIIGANAYGGIVEIIAEDIGLCLNDGSYPRFIEAGKKVPEKNQLHIEFDDESSLTVSVQMYGGMTLVQNDDWQEDFYKNVAKTKVSPIAPENTLDYFLSLMDEVKPNYSIKAFLATEQRYPGLGNGVLQDILYNAKINPRRKLNSMSGAEKEAVYLSVKQTMLDMLTGGGRNTEKDLFGCSGGYQTKLSAKTKGKPCDGCGDGIVREAFLGGNVYYCPTCQPYSK
ncbi:MAG: endonuclease VIII [Lachnospiraceae bacterium]|nr:endonuclease VIII [Lachnospiraceae bacterium]